MPILKQTFALVMDDGREYQIGNIIDELPPHDGPVEELIDRMTQDFRAALAFKASPDLDELVASEVKKKHCSPDLAPTCGRCKGGCRWKRGDA